MKALFLCAGFATRLAPLTDHRAKPLLDVGGQPVLSWIAERVAAIDGLNGAVLVSNARFASDFRDWAATAPLPVEVLDDGAESNATRRGAVADIAFAFAQSRVRDDAEGVVVVAGDNLFSAPLDAAARRFRAGEDHLLVTRRIPHPVPPQRYSEVLVDDAGFVTRLREKPAQPESDLSALCLYFFKPGVDADVALHLREGGNPDATGHFIAWLAERRRLATHEVAGEVIDIGDLASLERARVRWAGPKEKP